MRKTITPIAICQQQNFILIMQWAKIKEQKHMYGDNTFLHLMTFWAGSVWVHDHTWWPYTQVIKSGVIEKVHLNQAVQIRGHQVQKTTISLYMFLRAENALIYLCWKYGYTCTVLTESKLTLRKGQISLSLYMWANFFWTSVLPTQLSIRNSDINTLVKKMFCSHL